jgi:hypothetical protein
MSMDDVIQIIKPAPDSQYLLLRCPVCEGDNVAYVQTAGDGELWHGKCFDCDFTGDGAAGRHDAQLNWNKAVRDMRFNGCPCKDCTERFTACSDRCPKDARGEYGHKAWLADFRKQEAAIKEYKRSQKEDFIRSEQCRYTGGK